MRFARWIAVAAFVALLLPAGGASAAGSADPMWRDWNSGLKAAASTGKPVLVDVYTDWCGWCKRLDRDVYSRADVRDYLQKHFVTVKLNADAVDPASYEGRNYTLRTLAARFDVSSYPTTIFLKPGGEHLTNLPGYLPPERFLLVLHYIGDGHMERGVSWESFQAQTPAGETGRR